jgi:hypothetical protein
METICSCKSASCFGKAADTTTAPASTPFLMQDRKTPNVLGANSQYREIISLESGDVTKDALSV